MKTLPLLPLLLLLLAPGGAPAADDPPAPQLYFAARFIEADEKLLKKTDILSEDQFQKKLRDLSQRDGTKILSAPSVVALDSQPAKIEVIREFPYPARRDGRQPSFDTINVGVTLEIEGAIDEDRVNLVGKATVREVDEGAPRKFLFLKSKPPPVQAVTRKRDQAVTSTSFNTTEIVFDAYLKHGHTLLIPCRQSPKIDGQLLLVITAQLLDPAGKPLTAFKTAPSRPKIAKGGKKLPFQ